MRVYTKPRFGCTNTYFGNKILTKLIFLLKFLKTLIFLNVSLFPHHTNRHFCISFPPHIFLFFPFVLSLLFHLPHKRTGPSHYRLPPVVGSTHCDLTQHATTSSRQLSFACASSRLSLIFGSFFFLLN